MNATNSYIGNHIERVEDYRLLTGRGQYLDDLSRPNMLHAAIIRSPMAHGRIVSLDTSAALEMSGVTAVLTAADIQGDVPVIPFRRPNPTIGPYAQPVIAREWVRYFGEPLGIVLASRPEIAEDALAQIWIDIDPLQVVTGRDDALAGETLLFPVTSSNVAAIFTGTKGDADSAFAEASLIVGDDFSTQRQTALPMETRGLLAEWDEDNQHLRVFGAAKLPFFNRRAMAAMMKLPETSVDYIEVDVGGGFGVRGEFYPEDFLVAFAARTLCRAVKWVEDRREHFTASGHARECKSNIEMAFDKMGRILGLRGDIYANVGAYVRPNGMTPVRNCAQFMSGPYRIPNIGLTAYAYVSNKTPAGTYRGPGRYEGCFFIERLMDMAAGRLKLDRLDIRRRNLLTHAEMPYPLAEILPSDGSRSQTSCDSGEYREAFERCLTEFDWAGKAYLDGMKDGNCYHGLAISAFIEGGASGPSEAARMSVNADGCIEVYVGSSSLGQGLETVMTQIAADALAVPMERIRIFHGSTNYLKEGWGSFGSRATVMGGNAVMMAAEKLIRRFRELAAATLKVEASTLLITGDVAISPSGESVTMADVASLGMASEARFDNSNPTYTYGAAAAHLTVDVCTGEVKILDYVVCDDVGRIINSMTLHGQVIGAVIQGFGSVFGEELVYDDYGTLMVGTLADYFVPLATDYPHVRCVSMESYPSPTNPLGAKGAGEGGIIAVGATVANAVASALRVFDVKPNNMPLSPYRVWEMIRKAKEPRP